MQRFFHLMFLAFLPLKLFAGLPVTEDFEKAKEMARVYNKPMVVMFTGSDWCPWSKKLLHDILQEEQFQEGVKNAFIFVKIDFPDASQQGAEKWEDNFQIKEDYGVTDFPAVLMLDQEGREITRLSYMPHAPRDYAKMLMGKYMQYQELYRDVELAKLQSYSVNDLEKLYVKANQLHCPRFLNLILDEGSHQSEGVFLPIEKYSRLLHDGEKESKEAKELKNSMCTRDPQNNQGTLLRLAILDFQSNVESSLENPEKAVEPLTKFIEKFGDKEKETLWRLHLMISECFQKAGKKEKAKIYAEKSLEAAEAEAKPKVQKFLDALDKEFVN